MGQLFSSVYLNRSLNLTEHLNIDTEYVDFNIFNIKIFCFIFCQKRMKMLLMHSSNKYFHYDKYDYKAAVF